MISPPLVTRALRSLPFPVCLLLAVSCGGDSSVAPGATLTVITVTQDGVVDADGYTVQVGAGASTPLGVNSSVTINGVQTGAQTVTLSGLAPNCGVNGANPVSIQIQSGQNASVTFSVICTALPGGTYRIALMTNRDPSGALGSWEINSMNSDGSIVPLTSNTAFDGYPSWSPDGQKIAFGSDRDDPS